MDIPVELLAIFMPIGALIIFWIFLGISKKYKLWRYKPENDKGRRAEEFRKSRIGSTEATTFTPRPKLLPTTNIASLGQNSTSERVPSPSPSKAFNPFLRR